MDNVQVLLGTLQQQFDQSRGNPNIKEIFRDFDEQIHYSKFVTEEAVQFIRGCSPQIKQWVVSVITKQMVQTTNEKLLPSCINLFVSLLKSALNDLPAGLNLAKEIVVGSIITLSYTLKMILLQSQSQSLWTNYQTLNLMIVKLIDSPSDTLRMHAFKYIESLILCFSFPDDRAATDKFNLAHFPPSIQPLIPATELEKLGMQYFQQLIKHLRTLLEKSTKFSVQIVIMNCLHRLMRKRASLSTPVINTLTELVLNLPTPTAPPTGGPASLFNVTSHARSVYVMLRHILLSVVKHPPAQWQEAGSQLMDALTTKLDAQKLVMHLRPDRFRELRKHHPGASLPPPKRPKLAHDPSPSVGMPMTPVRPPMAAHMAPAHMQQGQQSHFDLLVNLTVANFEKMTDPPASYVPKPAFDATAIHTVFTEVVEVGSQLQKIIQMQQLQAQAQAQAALPPHLLPPPTSHPSLVTAETNVSRDPRRDPRLLQADGKGAPTSTVQGGADKTQAQGVDHSMTAIAGTPSSTVLPSDPTKQQMFPGAPLTTVKATAGALTPTVGGPVPPASKFRTLQEVMTLSNEQREHLSDRAIERIMVEQERPMRLAGKERLRIQILTRMLAMHRPTTHTGKPSFSHSEGKGKGEPEPEPEDEDEVEVDKQEQQAEPEGKAPGGVDPLAHPLTQKMIRYLVDQFAARFSLTVQWLYQEYANDLLHIATSQKATTTTTDHTALKFNAEEWEASRQNVLNENSKYSQLLKSILDQVQEKFPKKSSEQHSLFRQFLLQVPDLTAYTFDLLQRICESEDEAQLGIESFCDIALHRPAYMQASLDALLSYAIYHEDTVRGLAVAVVTEKLFHSLTSEVGRKIADFAIDAVGSLRHVTVLVADSTDSDLDPSSDLLDHTATDTTTTTTSTVNGTATRSSRSTTGAKPSNDMDDDMIDDSGPPSASTSTGPDGDVEMSEASEEDPGQCSVAGVKQRIQLFMRLALREKSLVKNLIAIYATLIPKVKRIIWDESVPLFKSLGQTHPVVSEILSEPIPQGSEMFVLHMLRLITESSSNLPNELISAIKALHERQHNAAFLIPILPALSKHEILEYLPQIVAINSKLYVKTALHAILNTTARDDTLSPTDLLIQLHMLDPKKHDFAFKKQFEATQLCVASDVFTTDRLASVLQQLRDAAQIPKLYLRTVIDSLQKYPRLIDFVVSDVLAQLIPKKVWDDPTLWSGFITCCLNTKPKSFPVIVQLPPLAFVKFLKEASIKYPNLKQDLMKYCKNTESNTDKKIISALEDFDLNDK